VFIFQFPATKGVRAITATFKQLQMLMA